MMQQPGTGVVPQPMQGMPSDQQGQQQYQQHPPAPQQWMMNPQQQVQPQQVPSAAAFGPMSYAQPQALQTQQYQSVPNTSSDEIRSLWIGDLLPWMDENYLVSCFAQTGEVNMAVKGYLYT